MRLLLAALLALHGIAPAFAFSDGEKARILSHGPWPPKLPLSANAATIALGERLFYDPRLSGTGSVLCATCQVPYRAFQDARPRAFGLESAALNTPSLVNVALYRRYGWDGAQDKLWAQSIRPILEPKEMRATPAHVARLIRERFAADYERAFGQAVPADDEDALRDAGRALAAFQETLVSGRTPFDEFRDALERGDAVAAARYPGEAQRGLALFVGKGNCGACHAGPLFTNASVVGGFRVPGLRNVALTAPYMHDGSLPTLGDAVRRHFGAIDSKLTPRESEELVAFLRSLSDVVRKDQASRDVRP